MSVRVFKAFGWRNVGNTKIRVRRSGAWKNIVRIRIYKGGAWKLVHPPLTPPPPPPPPSPPPPSPPPPASGLSVYIDPTTVYGVKSNCPPNGPVVTNPSAAAVVSGGTPPYTYQWEAVSWNSPAAPVIANPTSNSTKFTVADNGSSDNETQATIRCRVTDALAAQVTATVEAIFLTNSLL